VYEKERELGKVIFICDIFTDNKREGKEMGEAAGRGNHPRKDV